MTQPPEVGDTANAAFYDRDAQTYDATRFADEYGARESTRLRGLLLRRVPADPPPHVLEVGCGTGRATQWLAACADRLTLVDVAPAMLDAASGRALAANPDLDLTATKGSAFELPFDSRSFDVVVSINMLGHLSDLESAVGELARVLRPGGTMIVSAPSLYSIFLPAGLVVNRRREAIGQNVYSRWPSRTQMKRAFELGSMDVVGVDGAVHVPRATRRVPLVPRLLSGADALAARSRLAAGLAPWLLWSATKRDVSAR